MLKCPPGIFALAGSAPLHPAIGAGLLQPAQEKLVPRLLEQRQLLPGCRDDQDRRDCPPICFPGNSIISPPPPLPGVLQPLWSEPPLQAWVSAPSLGNRRLGGLKGPQGSCCPTPVEIQGVSRQSARETGMLGFDFWPNTEKQSHDFCGWMEIPLGALLKGSRLERREGQEGGSRSS